MDKREAIEAMMNGKKVVTPARNVAFWSGTCFMYEKEGALILQSTVKDGWEIHEEWVPCKWWEALEHMREGGRARNDGVPATWDDASRAYSLYAADMHANWEILI